MKNSKLILILLCALLYWADLSAQKNPFGLGISIGEPTGINAKLWVTPTNAFDFGLGWSIGGDRMGNFDQQNDGSSRIHFHFDYLFHIFNVIASNNQFPIYYGIGSRFNTGGGYLNSLAVRFVVGLAWIPIKIPIDLFVEFAPSLQLTSEPGFAIDSAIGIRYYF